MRKLEVSVKRCGVMPGKALLKPVADQNALSKLETFTKRVKKYLHFRMWRWHPYIENMRMKNVSRLSETHVPIIP
jgi:hypothetical protein